MNQKFLEEVEAQIQRASECGFVDLDAIEGTSNTLIKEIEKQFNVKLPSVYTDFLQRYGYKAGELLGHSVIREYTGLNDLLEEVEEMLIEENMSFSIPNKAFFFASFQGVDYWYFMCDGTDNPDVLYLEEDATEAVYFSTLSFFLVQAFKEAIGELRYFSGQDIGLSGRLFPDSVDV